MIDQARMFTVQALVAIAAGVCAAGAARVPGGSPEPGGFTLPPERLWHFAVPGRGAPVIDDQAAYFLSKDHEVVAIDIESGEPRWRRRTYETGDLLSGAALLVSGEHLVVGDYNLLAFDRRTGGLRWRFIPAQGHAPGVYLGTISRGAAIAGSASGHVYAVDTEHGALRWSTRIAADDRITVYAPAASADRIAVAFTEFTAPTRGGVALLEAGSGRVVWKRAFPAPADPWLSTNWAGGPVFLGDAIVASSGDGNIYAFGLDSGEIRWTIPPVTGALPFPYASDRDFRALAVDGDVLISSSLTGLVVGYDTGTREERWRHVARGLGSAAFRIAAAEGTAYVPFMNGLLVAIDSANGRERWRIGNYESGFLWPPAVRGDRLVVNGAGEGMVAMRDRR